MRGLCNPKEQRHEAEKCEQDEDQQERNENAQCDLHRSETGATSDHNGCSTGTFQDFRSEHSPS